MFEARSQTDAENFSINVDENLLEELNSDVLDDYIIRIDVNHAQAQDFMSLGIFNESEIAQILNFIAVSGPLFSLLELQHVPTIPWYKWQRALPFLEVDLQEAAISKATSTYLLTRVEWKSTGVESVNRMRHTGHKTDVGLIMKKQAGEPLMWNPSISMYGYDHYSGYVDVRLNAKKDRLIIGDYLLNAGEGLVFGGGLHLGKGSSTITSVKNIGADLRPISASSPIGYLRGLSAKFQLSKQFQLIPFYSNTHHDASIKTSDEGPYFSSINASGLHRDFDDFKGKGNLNRQLFGFIISRTWKQLQVGVTHSEVIFNIPYRPIEELRNAFLPSGANFKATSIFADVHLGNSWVFSEWARTGFKSWGGVVGMIKPMGKSFDFSVHLRGYSPSFYSVLSNSLSEKTSLNGEFGSYFGWKWNVSKSVELASYLDVFRFPWLYYQSSAPSSGREWLSIMDWKVSNNFTLSLRWRKELKFLDSKMEGLLISTPELRDKTNNRLMITYKPSREWTIQSRIQTNTINHSMETSKGALVSFETTHSKGRGQMSGRVMSFTIDEYQNREYIYEKEPWSAFSIPAFQGNGWSYYLYTKWTLGAGLTCWLKWSDVRYFEKVEQISPSNQNKNGRLKIQLRYKF